MVNIADQPEWSNLLRFQYALLVNDVNIQGNYLNL